MKHISSRDNPVFKRLVRQQEGRRSDEVLLEGVHLCLEWLRHQGPPVLAIFDVEKLAQHAELAELASAVPESSRIMLDAVLARQLSHVEHGQGVYFLVEVAAPPLPARIGETCVWLDRVQDPGNVGTLLRTAAAAGIRQVYLSPGCAWAWSPKVLRSAQGAHFALEIHERADLRELHGRLDVPLVATALQDSESLYARALPERCAWLIGNEGQGVDPDLLRLATRRVFIPQEPGVESLNAAIAAAICLFEHRRQYLSGHPGES